MSAPSYYVQWYRLDKTAYQRKGALENRATGDTRFETLEQAEAAIAEDYAESVECGEPCGYNIFQFEDTREERAHVN